MNYSSDQISDAAKAIRPYISDLLDPPRAQQLEQQMDRLLPDLPLAQGNHPQFLKILSDYEAIREWIRLYLEEQYPAEEILKTLRVYYPLPGLKHSVESPRYICPVENCHQDWYRHSREETIPQCPIHDLQLVINS